MNVAWLWLVHNPIATTAMAIWLIANVAPRPHPAEMTSNWKVFWLVIDRLCVLTAGGLPGGFKMLFLASPPTLATIALTAQDAPLDKDEKS